MHSMVHRFRLRSIEAIQYDGKNFIQISNFTEGKAFMDGENLHLFKNMYGNSPPVLVGDWICKSANGFFHKPKYEFEQTYEPVDE